MNKAVNLEHYLKQYFNYETFHEGQKEIIQDILNGNNVFGVLPTGSGKSLCYQLPAKLLNGTTIVVSPLISLMIDQVRQLKAIQYKDVAALNSFVSWQERQVILNRLSHYSLIYISPELLQDEYVLNQLKKIHVNLFVIDEAHCVSQWGHEFRTDYLRIPHVINQLGNPTILALSATAPEAVQDDTISLLKLTNVTKHIYPIDRPNIALIINKVTHEQEKIEQIVRLLEQRRVPTIIYFLSRRRSEEVALLLSNRLQHRQVAFYHGGMESIDRINIQQQFMNDEIDIICCTSAFGMGINKHNIRLIIHFHLPVDIESFIQEIGRAGRDGCESVSVSFYTESDIHLPLNIIDQQLPTEREIDLVFAQLYHLHNERDNAHHLKEKLNDYCGLSDTQIEFLTYQLEKYGIINDDIINYDKQYWQDVKKKIIQFKDERLFYKQNNLNSMITWLNTDQCLRNTLYSMFQSSYRAPSSQCCSNCNFSFEKWSPTETERKQSSNLNWEHKLEQLLLIGD